MVSGLHLSHHATPDGDRSRVSWWQLGEQGLPAPEDKDLKESQMCNCGGNYTPPPPPPPVEAPAPEAEKENVPAQG